MNDIYMYAYIKRKENTKENTKISLEEVDKMKEKSGSR